MKDVALHAGVSQSTVSFVLNGLEDMRISRETRKRVKDAVDVLGYRPRGAGRPSKYATRGVIGLMVDEIATSPFAAISIEGVQEEAWKNNIIISCHDRRRYAIRSRSPQEMGAGGCHRRHLQLDPDTLIIPPGNLARHRAVLLNCYEDQGQFPSIVPAERRGGEDATKVLLNAGHRRIAFITGENWMEASDQRMEGYERALRAARIPVDSSLIVEGNFLPSGGRDATLQLMAGKTRPDAIFCANDLMAVGCYEALKELGEEIGETIAVMGYDDQEIAQHLSPGLTTVLLPHAEMGQWCLKELLKTKIEQTMVRLPCPVVIRRSHTSN